MFEMRHLFLFAIVFLIFFGSFDGERGVVGCVQKRLRQQDPVEAVEPACARPLVVKCECSCPLFSAPK